MKKFFIVSYFLLGLLLVLALIFVFTRTADVIWNGFGTNDDQNNSLYVSRFDKVETYEDGQLVRWFVVPFKGRWSFGLYYTSSGFPIIASDGNTIYRFSEYAFDYARISDYDAWWKNGSEEPDINAETYHTLKQNREAKNSAGVRYRLESPWGWHQIRDWNGKIVYRLPVIDYVTRVLFVLSLGGTFLLTLAGVAVHITRRRLEKTPTPKASP